MALTPQRIKELRSLGYIRLEREGLFTAPGTPTGVTHRGLPSNSARVAVTFSNGSAGQVRFGNSPETSTSRGILLDTGGGFVADWDTFGLALGREWYFVGVTADRAIDVVAWEVYEP